MNLQQLNSSADTHESVGDCSFSALAMLKTKLDGAGSWTTCREQEKGNTS